MFISENKSYASTYENLADRKSKLHVKYLVENTFNIIAASQKFLYRVIAQQRFLLDSELREEFKWLFSRFTNIAKYRTGTVSISEKKMEKKEISK